MDLWLFQGYLFIYCTELYNIPIYNGIGIFNLLFSNQNTMFACVCEHMVAKTDKSLLSSPCPFSHPESWQLTRKSSAGTTSASSSSSLEGEYEASRGDEPPPPADSALVADGLPDVDAEDEDPTKAT